LKELSKVKTDDVALLMALSSKRVVSVSTNAESVDLIYGTISGNTIAISGGADIIRVHNVKENVLSAKMTDAIMRG
jgi:dihydropteroate synthase